MVNFYDMTSFNNAVEVSRARLFCDTYPWLYAQDMTATEVRSILSTKVCLW